MDQSAISFQASQRVTTAPTQFYGGAGLAAERADSNGVQRLAKINTEFGNLVKRDDGNTGDQLAYRKANYIKGRAVSEGSRSTEAAE